MKLRVIAGELKGRKLQVTKGLDIRPTSDRTREALFSIIGSDESFNLRGATVLDLFAGTGALGIESISRGAASALFIDSSKNSLDILKKNIKTVGAEQKTRVINWDISKNLDCLREYEKHFDLVFMDPPYEQGLITKALTNLLASGAINPSAMIVIEHSAKETPTAESPLELIKTKKYGKSCLTFLEIA